MSELVSGLVSELVSGLDLIRAAIPFKSLAWLLDGVLGWFHFWQHVFRADHHGGRDAGRDAVGGLGNRCEAFREPFGEEPP